MPTKKEDSLLWTSSFSGSAAFVLDYIILVMFILTNRDTLSYDWHRLRMGQVADERSLAPNKRTESKSMTHKVTVWLTYEIKVKKQLMGKPKIHSTSRSLCNASVTSFTNLIFVFLHVKQFKLNCSHRKDVSCANEALSRTTKATTMTIIATKHRQKANERSEDKARRVKKKKLRRIYKIVPKWYYRSECEYSVWTWMNIVLYEQFRNWITRPSLCAWISSLWTKMIAKRRNATIRCG